MEFRLRERPSAGPKAEQEVGDDAVKNEALSASAAARAALAKISAADTARERAKRLKLREQREKTQARGNYGGCVC